MLNGINTQNYQQITPLLIACPVHENREYAMERWINSVPKIRSDNGKVIQLYDFSPSMDFAKRWEKKAEVNKIDFIYVGGDEKVKKMQSLVGKMNITMDMIRHDFLSAPYKAWLDIEIDIVAPPNTYEFLSSFPNYDWIAHGYPAKNGPENFYQNGFGCSLFSRRILTENQFEGSDVASSDGAFWQSVKNKQYCMADVFGFLGLQHLGS